jgi:pimeloyl-ACP methyl ester carboxylesterase
MDRARLRGLVMGLGILLVAGCTTPLAPDLETLFRPEQMDDPAHGYLQPPVVVIPGLLGSRLVSAGTGEEAWPGGAFDLAFSRYEAIELPVDGKTRVPEPLPSALEAGGVTETALGRDFYGRIIDTLVRYGGYRRARLGEGPPVSGERRVYVFDYDWRQDNVTTVRKLKVFLDGVRKDYGDGGVKFDIVAHSMGGLVARYFLRFGDEDVLRDNRLKVTWAGAPYLNKIILLGTPNLGSLSSIEGFVRGQKVGFARIPEEVVATLPSTYQLFPHRIVRWLVDEAGEPVNMDPFSARTWQRYGWNIFSPEVKARVIGRRGEAYYRMLTERFREYGERARRFSWSLTVCPDYDEKMQRCATGMVEPPLRYVVFGGSCSETPARAVLQRKEAGREAQGADQGADQEADQAGSQWLIRFRPSEVSGANDRHWLETLMFDPGDGTVTKPSLLARDALNPLTPRHEYSYFPLGYAFLLCEDHSTLTGNPHFQNNLLDVLLTRARPWELHLDHANRRR